MQVMDLLGQNLHVLMQNSPAYVSHEVSTTQFLFDVWTFDQILCLPNFLSFILYFSNQLTVVACVAIEAISILEKLHSKG